jgi:hypothetical protein
MRLGGRLGGVLSGRRIGGPLGMRRTEAKIP